MLAFEEPYNEDCLTIFHHSSRYWPKETNIIRCAFVFLLLYFFSRSSLLLVIIQAGTHRVHLSALRLNLSKPESNQQRKSAAVSAPLIHTNITHSSIHPVPFYIRVLFKVRAYSPIYVWNYGVNSVCFAR